MNRPWATKGQGIPGIVNAAGLVVAGFGVGAFVYTRFARQLVVRMGKRNLLLMGGAGVMAGPMGLDVSPNSQFVAATQVLSSLMFYMFDGALQARANEALPEARGAAVSAAALALFMGRELVRWRSAPCWPPPATARDFPRRRRPC